MILNGCAKTAAPPAVAGGADCVSVAVLLARALDVAQSLVCLIHPARGDHTLADRLLARCVAKIEQFRASIAFDACESRAE